MFTRTRAQRLTRAAVATGTVALLVASPLTGTAAAKTKGKPKAPTVKLTAAQLKAVDALVAKDVKADETPGPVGATGAQGAPGTPGANGSPGAPGAPGTATISPDTITGAGLTGSPASDIEPGTIGSTDFAPVGCPIDQLMFGFSGLASNGLDCTLVQSANLAPDAVELDNLNPGVTTLTSPNGTSLSTGCSDISFSGSFPVDTWITSIQQPTASNSHFFLIPDGPSTIADRIGVTACDLSSSDQTIAAGTTYQALMIDAG